MEKDVSTEQRILSTAKSIFEKKGLTGTRMQEIADAAGINKALLHYYFRNKEKLFEAVFSEALAKIFPRINEIFSAEIPLFRKIEVFVENYIEMIMENPHLPAFVTHELNQNPDRFIKNVFQHESAPVPHHFLLQIEAAIRNGEIRPVHPAQLMINLLSLCIFPFIAKPLIQSIFNIQDETFSGLMEARKKEVSRFIINSIKL